MPYQSLYRRYRPRRFADVRGQQQVVEALRNAVREERIGHAYLFSGPRGTGKTSTARILAKALNCTDLRDGEPCCECASCLDVEAGTSYDLVELDAASNNGVNDIRELVKTVALTTGGRAKVYILDEVHMLSPGASNALLKTLEEPPGHVVFVLATTDPTKVLATIRSRTQHFEFHLLPADEMADHVRWVIGEAGLDVTDDGVEQVLRQGGGSARDTLSALDQVAVAGSLASAGDQAERLVDAVDAARVPTMVNLTWRYTDAVRSFLDSVGAAEPIGGRGHFISGAGLGGPFATPWRLEHGPLLDLGPHVIDILDAALGTVTGVRAHGHPQRWVGLLLDHGTSAVSEVSLSASSNVGFQAGFEVFTHDRSIALDASTAVTPEVISRLVDEFTDAVARWRGHPIDVHRGLHLQRLLHAALLDLR